LAEERVLPITTLDTILVAAICVDVVALAATVYFTRATARRVAGALIGGVAVGVVGVGIETLAHALGWWRYPPVKTVYGPPLIYPVVVLLFAALALVGWRVARRFGWRGQAAFLIAVAVFGTLRDYRVAALRPEFIVFAPGIRVALIDAACWGGLLAFAHAVMCLVAGPSKRDPLARQPGRPIQTLGTS
jgi:hypothetical protein